MQHHTHHAGVFKILYTGHIPVRFIVLENHKYIHNLSGIYQYVTDLLLVFSRFIRLPLNCSSPCFRLLEFTRCVPCTLWICPVHVCVTGNFQMLMKQLINLSTPNKMKLRCCYCYCCCSAAADAVAAAAAAVHGSQWAKS